MKNKIQTSKKLAAFACVCFAAALVFSMIAFIYCAKTDRATDMNVLITLITVTGGAFGVTMATYSNKSRYENVIKEQRKTLKTKYLILKDVGALDEERLQRELEDELSKIDLDAETEKTESNQTLSYNK
jgi:glucan phosphoethanolaminetransferase (alkaline phosphatase superfamily)